MKTVLVFWYFFSILNIHNWHHTLVINSDYVKLVLLIDILCKWETLNTWAKLTKKEKSIIMWFWLHVNIKIWWEETKIIIQFNNGRSEKKFNLEVFMKLTVMKRFYVFVSVYFLCWFPCCFYNRCLDESYISNYLMLIT